jgi:hypothetical protein
LNFKLWFLVFSFLLFASLGSSANALPAANDINSLAQSAKSTVDAFLQQSFEPRMKYEFSGRFLNPNDKDNLYKLAKDSADHLQEVAQNQQMLKKQIEDYQGDDWDVRYGSTGLWRKLSTDIYTTKLSRFEIDYYLALASEQPQRSQILHLILSEMDSLAQSGKRFGPNLIRGKTLALLAQTEPSYKDVAVKEFEAFTVYSDIYQPTAAAIEKMKLLSPPDTNQLNILVKTLQSNWYDRYLELMLSLMFLQRQYDPEAFEKTVQSQPQIKDFVGTLILEDLVNRISQRQTTEDNLEQIGVFEAELAVQAAWKDETKNYKKLLSCLSNTERFQTPLILYVTATALAESSPAKAVNLLVKASKMQQQKSDRLNIEPYRIAEQAAQLAYNLFAEDPCNGLGHTAYCSVAVDAFDNYSAIAADRIDEELEYFYSSILRDCGKVEESEKLLQKIANRPTGLWRRRAKLDLILQQMQQNRRQKTSQDELLEQLRSFILNCPGRDNKDSAIRAEAMNIYCRSLLERADSPSAQKVLDVLDKAEETRGIQLDFFKAKAFQQIGELEQAVHYMVSAIMDDSGSFAPEVTQLLSEVTENIEQFESQAKDFSEMLDSCKELAEFSNKSLDNRQTALLLAEFLVFASDNEQDRLTEAESLLNTLAKEADAGDVEFIRCRARLLTKQRKFDEAAMLWAKLCEIRKQELPLANQRSWKWWRAKYYELYCWSKLPQTKKADVAHSVEILESSFRNIPPLWAEKLSLLKSGATAK